ncbi:MAG: nucleotide pyrophosphohydrolase [Nanoarchaeota archaeon]
MDHKTNIHELKEMVRKFCEDRDWNQYHGAKDLAIGISTEAAELLEIFRFKSEDEIRGLFKNPEKKEHISEEVSDVLYFLLRFAQMNNIDMATAINDKIEKNNRKYPVDKYKGLNKKYNEY